MIVRIWQFNRPALLGVLLICSSIILGGGGQPNPGAELALAMAASIIALIWIFTPQTARANALEIDRGMILLIGLIAILPVAQLVPLPPSIQAALPGREFANDALALVGAQNSWRPFTLVPSRTLSALLGLVPPILIMLIAIALPRDSRRWLVAAVCVGAVASILLGVSQLAGGAQAPYFYSHSHVGWLTGTFANRNAAADFLLIGIIALATLLAAAPSGNISRVWGGPRAPHGVLFLALTALLALGVVLTGSRAGMAMLPLAFLAQWLVLRFAPEARGKHAGTVIRYLPWVAGAGAMFIAALVYLQGKSAFRGAVNRFFFEEDFRTELWADAWFAMMRFWPLGGGIGSFVPSMNAAERLEVLDASPPNRAHNDYLEWTLETGLPGILVLLAIAVLLLKMAIRQWREPAQRPFVILSLGILTVVSLHSFVDYPMRSMAIAGLAGLAAGLLAPPPNGIRDGNG